MGFDNPRPADAGPHRLVVYGDGGSVADGLSQFVHERDFLSFVLVRRYLLRSEDSEVRFHEEKNVKDAENPNKHGHHVDAAHVFIGRRVGQHDVARNHFTYILSKLFSK